VFFGSGGHVKEDLPELVKSIKSEHQDLDIFLEPPVGEQPEIITAIARSLAP
jgi:sirohydrochlorin cobaltochelatase